MTLSSPKRRDEARNIICNVIGKLEQALGRKIDEMGDYFKVTLEVARAARKIFERMLGCSAGYFSEQWYVPKGHKNTTLGVSTPSLIFYIF